MIGDVLAMVGLFVAAAFLALVLLILVGFMLQRTRGPL